MKLIVKLFGILFFLAGISLLINPDYIFNLIENNMKNTSLYLLAIVIRLVFGILFIITSKESKFPLVIKILGFLFIISAVIFIFIGYENFQELISTIILKAKPYARISGLLSIVFGGFLINAFSNNKKSLQN